MIKAIVWDIGGVLLTDPQLDNFWKKAEGSKELRTKFGEGKLSIEGFVNEGSKLLNIPTEEFHKNYENIYCAVVELPNTTNLVNMVKCPQYILSDTNPIHGEFIQKKYSKLFSHFKKLFMSYKIGMRKNSSAVFNYVAKEIGIPSKEILFIDNKQKLLDYAKEAGYQTFLFENAYDLKIYLSKKKLLLD